MNLRIVMNLNMSFGKLSIYYIIETLKLGMLDNFLLNYQMLCVQKCTTSNVKNYVI